MTELEKLVEKDAIRDQYYVYARALDRIDNPLGKTVFAEDAQVDYGPTYKGTGYGFIDMMLKMHRKMVSTHHVMTNILIKLNEDGWALRDYQQEAAEATRDAFQAELTRHGHGAISTQLAPFETVGPFYLAEDYHQQYLHKNPGGYCNHGPNGVT